MAHFNPIVMARFSEVHLGPPTDFRLTPAGRPDKLKFENPSKKDEIYHTSGDTTQTLQSAIQRAIPKGFTADEASQELLDILQGPTGLFRIDQTHTRITILGKEFTGRQVYFLQAKFKQLPVTEQSLVGLKALLGKESKNIANAERSKAKLVDNLAAIGDFKRTLVRKNSEEALNALQDTETELKDFGKTHEKSSLPERLLGDSGFEPIAQFMGDDHEAKLFTARILKRSFQKDITETINSGRWPNPKQYDPEAMAQQQAEDVVEAYRPSDNERVKNGQTG